MNVIKLDVEKLDNAIIAFINMYNKNPYIICSKATKELLPINRLDITSIGVADLGDRDLYLIENKLFSNKERFIINTQIKILVDDSLKYGEIEVR